MTLFPEPDTVRRYLRRYSNKLRGAHNLLNHKPISTEPLIFEVRIPHCHRARWENVGRIHHSHFISLNSFMQSSMLTPGAISIAHKGLPVDMSLKAKPGTPLLVVLHGAAATDVRLPFLSGQSVSRQLNCSKLSISDPSLYLSKNLNLSWYAGNVNQPTLLSDIAGIISKAAQILNAPKIVLLGGSGGGFAAINLAARLQHSTAIAMNPQTDILRYHPLHVATYIKQAWNGDKPQFIRQASHNVAEVLENSQTKPTVLYLQNKKDEFHVKNHLNKFKDELPGFRFELLMKPWNDGHTPPPKELISATLKKVIEEPESDLAKLGFITQGPSAK